MKNLIEKYDELNQLDKARVNLVYILSFFSAVGLLPYFLRNRGRIIYLKIDFKRAKAIIAHAYRGERLSPIEFNLRNLRVTYIPNQDDFKQASPMRRSYSRTTYWNHHAYSFKAYDDHGERVDVKAGESEIEGLVSEDDCLEFDYFQFVVLNSERFEKSDVVIK